MGRNEANTFRPARPEKLVGSIGSHYSAHSVRGKEEEPFLKPNQLPLLPVPYAFSTVHQWCEIIAHNLRAEYFHVFTQAVEERSRRGHPMRFKAPKSNELHLDPGCVPEGEVMVHYLLKIGKNVHITTSQEDQDGVGVVAVRIKPPLADGTRSGTFLSLGYVGSYMSEYNAILELAHLREPDTPVLRSILQPARDIRGDYEHNEYDPMVPINHSQRQAVDSLSDALEKIQVRLIP